MGYLIKTCCKKYLITSKNFKRKKVIVDIDRENLFINEKSIFVSFEWLGRTVTKIKTSGIPTLVHMTYSVPQVFTYSRNLAQSQYHWFPFKYSSVGKENVKPTNTIFSIEVEQYK